MTIMNKKDYYKILELEKNATADEIKIAFRKLARKYHPDVTGGDEASNENFKNITEAYEILSNTQKKKDYDTLQGFYSYAEGEVKSKQKQANKLF